MAYYHSAGVFLFSSVLASDLDWEAIETGYWYIQLDQTRGEVSPLLQFLSGAGDGDCQESIYTRYTEYWYTIEKIYKSSSFFLCFQFL
jgi:hypothetical protein